SGVATRVKLELVSFPRVLIAGGRMDSSTHPLEWSSADVQMWLFRQSFDSFHGLRELTGERLWYMTQDEVKSMLADRHDRFWMLLQRLRRRSEDMSLLAALQCQSEDVDPSIMHVLTEEVELGLSSSFYADAICTQDTKRAKLMDADRKLALKLAQDWATVTETDTSLFLGLARQEEEAGKDADLARCIADLPDGAALVVLEVQAEHNRTNSIDALGELPTVPENLAEDTSSVRAGQVGIQVGADRTISTTENRDDSSLASTADADTQPRPGSSTEPGTTEVTTPLPAVTMPGFFDFDQLEVEEAAMAEDEVADKLGTGVSSALDEVQDFLDDLPPLEDIELLDCVACAESFAENSMSHFPCKHHMCCSCLRKFYCSALGDISMLPVTCCDTCLPVDLAEKALDSAEFNRFLKLSEEKMTVHKMFCPSPSCGQFINLGGLTLLSDSQLISCPNCSSELCVKCKSASHPGQSCEEHKSSSEDVALHATAAQFGWKQCRKCNIYVSLKHGCNHMTCFCNYEFCYVCLADWTQGKPCDCPLWDDQNLLREEERRVDAQEEELGRPLQQIEMANLRARLNQDNARGNECDHRSKSSFYERDFTRARSKNKNLRSCDNCGNLITSYCYECEGCRLRICRMCRHSRRLA
ncbi:unnamed protein product, partial [Polarella glacialis]